MIVSIVFFHLNVVDLFSGEHGYAVKSQFESLSSPH